jgi:hypothetical protein
MVGWLLCLCRIAEHNRPNLLGLACQYVCVGGLIFREDSPRFYIIFFYYSLVIIIGFLLLFRFVGKGARCLLYIHSSMVGVVKDSFLGNLVLSIFSMGVIRCVDIS